jgi:hypothetical protein
MCMCDVCSVLAGSRLALAGVVRDAIGNFSATAYCVMGDARCSWSLVCWLLQVTSNTQHRMRLLVPCAVDSCGLWLLRGLQGLKAESPLTTFALDACCFFLLLLVHAVFCRGKLQSLNPVGEAASTVKGALETKMGGG